MTYAEIERLYNSLPNRRDGSTAKHVPNRTATVIDRIKSDNIYVYEVRYHGTAVVTIANVEGKTVYGISNGGYATSITRQRINEYAPPKCYIKQYRMYYGDAPLGTYNVNGARSLGAHTVYVNEEGEVIA